MYHNCKKKSILFCVFMLFLCRKMGASYPRSFAPKAKGAKKEQARGLALFVEMRFALEMIASQSWNVLRTWNKINPLMPAGISIAEGEFQAPAGSISRIRTSGFISLLCAPRGRKAYAPKRERSASIKPRISSVCSALTRTSVLRAVVFKRGT